MQVLSEWKLHSNKAGLSITSTVRVTASNQKAPKMDESAELYFIFKTYPKLFLKLNKWTDVVTAKDLSSKIIKCVDAETLGGDWNCGTSERFLGVFRLFSSNIFCRFCCVFVQGLKVCLDNSRWQEQVHSLVSSTVLHIKSKKKKKIKTCSGFQLLSCCLFLNCLLLDYFPALKIWAILDY